MKLLKWYFYFSCVFLTLEKGEGFGGKYVVSPLFWLPAIFTDWTLSAKHGQFSWSAFMPPSCKTVWSRSLQESTEICQRQSCSMYVYYLKVFVWYFYGICMVLTEYLYPGCCVTGCASVWYWQSVFVFVFVFECICICICLCLCISRVLCDRVRISMVLTEWTPSLAPVSRHRILSQPSNTLYPCFFPASTCF